MSKHSGMLGQLFEQAFLTVLDSKDLKEGIDYVKSRTPNPDYFFPKTSTYVEVKFTSNTSVNFTKLQEERFKELMKKGFKVKLLLFRVEIQDVFMSTRISLNRFINTLV